MRSLPITPRLLPVALALLVMGVTSQATGQTALGDADGKTALVPTNSGAISINFSDNSAKAGYVWYKTAMPWRFGVEFSGKATNGYARLFDGEDIAPEAAAKIVIGWQPVKIKSEKEAMEDSTPDIPDRWFSLEVGYGRGEYRLIDPGAGPGAQLTTKTQDRGMVTLYGNALLAGNFLAGASLGYSQTNNYSRLRKVDLIETKIVNQSDTMTQVTQRTITGREGEYREFGEFTVNADIMWVAGIFNNRVGVDVFARYTSPEGEENTFEPGIGFFVLKAGAPSRIVAGITAKHDDAEDRIKLGLAAGYNF